MLTTIKINIVLHLSIICGLISSNSALISGSKSLLAVNPTGQVLDVASDPMGTVDGVTNADVKALIELVTSRLTGFEEATASTDTARGGAQALAAQAPAAVALQTENAVLQAAVQAAQVIEPLSASDIRAFTFTLIQAARLILDDLKKAKQCKSCTITYISLTLDFASSALGAATEAILNFHDTGSNNVFSNTVLQSAVKILLNYLLTMLNDEVILILQTSQSIMTNPLSVSCDTLESSAERVRYDAKEVECASYNVTLISFDAYPSY